MEGIALHDAGLAGELVIEAPRALAQLGWLREGVRARLVREGGALALPWGLALALQALAEDEGQAQALRDHLPDWLDEDAQEVLTGAVLEAALPALTSLRLRLRARGQAGKAGYRLVADWVDEDGLPLTAAPLIHRGLIRGPGGEVRRLSCGQLALVHGLERMSGELGRDRATDLLVTDRVKAMIPAGDGGVVLDRFLEREEVVHAHRVAPYLEAEGDAYRVRPRIEGVSDEALERYYDGARLEALGDGVLGVRSGLGRQRVVFTERAQAALRDLRQLGRLTAQQAVEALSDPAAFFGDNVDTSQLSERVVGLGLDIRTPVPRVREVKGAVWVTWQVELGALEVGADEEEEGPTLDLSDPETRAWLRGAIEEAQAQGRRFVVVPGSRVLLEVTAALIEALEAAEAEALAAAAARRPVLQVRDNVEEVEFEAQVEAGPARLPTLERPPALREGFELFPYQREGCAWLYARRQLEHGPHGGRPGALLADDMGLGKTLQVLSFLAHVMAEGEDAARRPHLVVAPVALLVNWREEAARFFGESFEPIFLVSGRALPAKPREAAALLAEQRLVLVSYATLRRHELSFAQVHWSTVILDEAQKAKNPDTQIARVVRTLRADFRLAMTGTPVENSLTELWTILDWLAPGLLGSLRQFSRDYVQSLQDDYDSRSEALASELHERIRPVFFRRTKPEVLGDALPSITHMRHTVELDEAQQALYEQIVVEVRRDRRRTLAGLGRLFALCAHPGMEEASGPGLALLSERAFPKGERLMALLEGVAAAGEKALIFANRTRVQRWLAAQIEARFGVEAPIINGSVTGSERRMAIVRGFSAASGFGALVLAPRAAGMGLNITAANHVIHYMREWNPAIENQATDRAYRIGQTRPVSVHHILSTAPRGVTVEQVLDGLLASKRQLMRDFVVPMGRPEISDRDLWSAIDPG